MVELTISNNYLLCESQDCKFKQECAIHCSAGDFRSEGGFTPKIELKLDKTLVCHTKNTNEDSTGSVYGTLPLYENTLGYGMLFLNDVIKEQDITYDI